MWWIGVVAGALAQDGTVSTAPSAEPGLLHRLVLVGDTGVPPKADVRNTRDARLDAEGGTSGAPQHDRTTLVVLGDVYYNDSGSLKKSLTKSFPKTGIPTQVIIGNHDTRPGGDVKTPKLAKMLGRLSEDGVLPAVDVVQQPRFAQFNDPRVCAAYGVWQPRANGLVGWPTGSYAATCTWRLVFTHHIYATSFDKVVSLEDGVEKEASEQRRTARSSPSAATMASDDHARLGSVDLWMNGHAHQLEGGAYGFPADGSGTVLAITSGAGAKYECPSGVVHPRLGPNVGDGAAGDPLTSIKGGCDDDGSTSVENRPRSENATPDWYLPGLGYTVVDLYDTYAIIRVEVLDPVVNRACFRWDRQSTTLTPAPACKP